MELDQAIDITAEQRKLLLELLERHLPNTAAWVYGSRAKWTSRPQSDLDLVVFATPEQNGQVGELREAFEESNLPFRVDLFVWDTVPEQFRKHIKRDHVVLRSIQISRAQGREVSSQWQEVRWGDLATLEYGRALRGYNTARGPFRVFGTNGPIGWHDEALCSHPSVIVGRKGAYRGVHYSSKSFFAIDTAFYLKPKREMDVRWAYYQLLTQDINGMDSGSAIPSTSRDEFYSLSLLLPPLPEQRAIAHILGTLDDKIELNRRMNETLEAMARALFKSWFVDFDPVRAKMEGRDPSLPQHVADLFPDRLVDSELGEIPEGWKVKRIEDMAERVAMGPFGSSIKVATFLEAGIPVISGQHLRGTLLEDNEYRFITKEHAERLAKANVRRGDVVFTHAGSIGQVAYIPKTSQFKRYVLSQRQFYMRCDVSQISPLFVVHFFKTIEGQHQLLANTSSTGVPSISRPVTYLRSIRLCIPPRALWRQFDEFVDVLHLKAARNTAESNILDAQRDTLLPKLISGELRARDAEIQQLVGRT